MPKEKWEYELDSSDNRLEKIMYKWDEEWIPDEREQKAYDLQGNIILKATFKWSVANQNWVGRKKEEFKFDDSGTNLSGAYYNWNYTLGAWEGSSRYDLVFNEMGLKSQGMFSAWNMDSADWEPMFITAIYYHHSGFKTHSIEYLWDTDLDSAFLNRKTYHRRGQYTISQLESICEGEQFIWMDESFSSEGIYQKDLVSALGTDSILSLELTVHPNPSPFELEAKTEVCKGETVLISAPDFPELVYFWSFENEELISEHNDTVVAQWNEDGDVLVKAWAKSTIGCTSDTTSLLIAVHICQGLNDSPIEGIQVFPVPVSGLLQVHTKVDFKHLEILDLEGRKRLLYHTSEHGYDLSTLPGGMYLIRFLDRSGKAIYVQKIVKK